MKLTARGSIALFAGLLSILLLAIGGTSIRALDLSRNQLVEYESDQTLVHHVLRARAAVNRRTIAAAEALSVATSGDTGTARTLASRAEQEAGASLAVLSQCCGESSVADSAVRAMVSELLGIDRRYEFITAQAVLLASTDRREEAVDLMTNEGGTLLLAYAQLSEKLTKYLQTDGDRHSEQALHGLDVQRLILLVAALLALIGAAACKEWFWARFSAKVSRAK